MTKVARIRFTSDEHHCEMCGWFSDDYGIEVWLDDKKIIDHPAGASCFGNSSECYSVLDQLDLIVDTMHISRSQLHKTDDQWTDEQYNSIVYDEYYMMLERKDVYQPIIERVFTQHGYEVVFEYSS